MTDEIQEAAPDVMQVVAVAPLDIGATAVSRVELQWPGKDLAAIPRQDAAGRWRFESPTGTRRLNSLVDMASYGARESGAFGHVVAGDRLVAAETLRRWYPRRVAFAYLDVPRIEIDDKAAAFRGDPTYAYSTWLSVLRSHLDAIRPLLARSAVVTLLCGDVEEPYARLLLAESFGRENYIGTIVWQRSYGPRNMRGMKEFTATHDCIVLFAVDKANLPAVGLRRGAEESGFANPDGDPRGPWRATHKGARTRREKSDFDTFVPPYRWRIVEGRLPAGLWRLNPLTGVIWGVPEEIGDSSITVEVSDRTGNVATQKLLVSVRDEACDEELPAIPWLFDEITTTGTLRVATGELKTAGVGTEFSSVLVAEGGDPFIGPPKRPGSGRYWEFANDTLVAAYARDKVDLGGDGDVIPRIKTYSADLDEIVQNQQTWWPAKGRGGSTFAGFTQDATKHLKKLQEVGLTSGATTASKPEHLLARLLSIFTSAGDTALELFGSTADLAAVALKLDRDFVYLAGSSDRDAELLRSCALGRLRAVVDGADRDLEARPGQIKLSKDAYIPFAGGGSLLSCRVGDWVFEQMPRDDYPRINRNIGAQPNLASAVLTSHGFLPQPEDSSRGVAPDGARAVVVPANEYLTPELAAQLASDGGGTEMTVFYFMASDEFNSSVAPSGMTYRRLPAEVVLFER